MIGTEQFSTWNNAAVDGAINFAHFGINTTERLVALNLETGRAALADAAKSAQGFEIKDLQDIDALRARITEAGWGKVSAYPKAAYAVLSGAQAELAAAVEQRAAQLQQQSAAALESAAKAAPVGAEPFIALLKSGLAASTSAFDTATKAARQFGSLADTGVTAAATKVAPKGKK